ncbi:LPXTG cell wall anchor domain-containing protein [Streptomyces sp. HC44]|uniref:LPXTG cell wall anchor domain-containing protein n=2 Tax=Streptomyces scabichelini TaxID=2711217 RepID=A0A6G4VES0_9ACTN|nr:LPXTG cell wall anchor domain-containing protein [Streptomyces scabichelini]
MNVLRRSAALAITVLALTAMPYTAEAHGSHPFKNCTEAYANGVSNIPKGDEHYGKHLDRDGDGVGCDKPPAGFVPADDEEENTGGEDESAGGSQPEPTEDTGSEAPEAAGQQDTDLAATGGSSSTPYVAGGGAAVLLAGGGLVIAARRRRTTR